MHAQHIVWTEGAKCQCKGSGTKSRWDLLKNKEIMESEKLKKNKKYVIAYD